MKDKIISWFRIITWLFLVIYIIYLLINGISFTNWNDIVLWWMLILFWLFLVVIWVYPICFNRPRLTQFFVWLFLMYFWYIFFKNNPNDFVFVSDILRILWALMMVLWPLWFCVNEKCKKVIEDRKKKVDESKIEIIEV